MLRVRLHIIAMQASKCLGRMALSQPLLRGIASRDAFLPLTIEENTFSETVDTIIMPRPYYYMIISIDLVSYKL